MWHTFSALLKFKTWIFVMRARNRWNKILLILLVFILTLLYSTHNKKSNTCIRWNNGLTISKIWKTKHQENQQHLIKKKLLSLYTTGSNRTNIVEDIINSNNYAPVAGAGERGRPVHLSPREVIYSRELYALHSFNIIVSDKISINRSLPDYRSESCKNMKISLRNLPSASIIIVYHNEAWSTLMRTLMSVVRRSPEKLLKEIILVDDASERLYLGKELDDALVELSVVSVIRNKIRSGVVGARLTGAQTATGDVLVFLDSHCEVTEGWLEPLLDRAVAEDVFVSPHIDLIREDTFEYATSADAQWGAFCWGLQYRWLIPSKELLSQMTVDSVKPYPTAAMAGGLYAVKRSLFWKLGSYDRGMSIWGGENIELSWRAWQCGARVEIAPCSRVGHIFRKESPYKYPNGASFTQYSNLARAAMVWMDDWANFFFKFHPEAARVRSFQTINERSVLREKLKCKNFEWYLNNIWPDNFFPNKDRWFGRIRNHRGICLGIMPSQTPWMGGPAVGVQCSRESKLENLLIHTEDSKIIRDLGLCLKTIKGHPVWENCGINEDQVWYREGLQMKTDIDKCLTLTQNAITKDNGYSIKVIKCNDLDGQKWIFEKVSWK